MFGHQWPLPAAWVVYTVSSVQANSDGSPPRKQLLAWRASNLIHLHASSIRLRIRSIAGGRVPVRESIEAEHRPLVICVACDVSVMAQSSLRKSFVPKLFSGQARSSAPAAIGSIEAAVTTIST